MPPSQRVTVRLHNGNLTFDITAERVRGNVYLLAIDAKQLKPYVESLPATDPDRAIMLTLLAFDGARPEVTSTLPDGYGGGSLFNYMDRFGKSAVKAMLVHSRRQKQVENGALRGTSREDDGPCEVCSGMMCGLNETIPFLDCLCIEGVFDGKCGNSLWGE